MRAVIQRVGNAEVRSGKEFRGSIESGLLIFLGVENGDDDSDVEYLANKILRLRIFEDEKGKMNRSIEDIKGEILVVSQFTLLGDCRKGTRPSFDDAASPDTARDLYMKFLDVLEDSGINPKSGEFGSYMIVKLINDGPVTILLDSKKVF